MAINRIYGATGLTGGATGDLDTIDGADLSDGDMAIVIDQDNDVVYFYRMDVDYNTAESSPDIIVPDSNNDNGNKCWRIETVYAPTMQYNPTPVTNLTATGFKATMTVDVNSTGVGAALYTATDGNLEEADADAAATMPCMAIALETGIGTKSVLLQGFMRNDSWSWASIGQPVYMSATAGAFTQTVPTGSGDQVQVIGVARASNLLYFRPDLTLIEVT